MNNLSNARHMDVARLAKRLDNIEPFYVVQVITRAIELEAQGKSIINLAVGEPDFPTPQPIVDAAVAALKSDRMRYSPSLGSDALRQALSNWYQSRYAVDVPAERIAVTSGASGALLLTMGMVISEGDEVLMPDPSYPCNRHFVSSMGGSAKLIPVGAETDYQLTSLLVEQNWTERTVGVMVASPSNPTGTLMDHDELRKIIEFVRGRGGVVIVDEIYQGLTYGGQERTALDISDDVFVINSFSKYFAMTGWRLGWAVMPEGYVEHFEKLAQNLYISNSDVAQRAALLAFNPETIEEAEKNRSRYKAQRDFLLPALRDLGFKIPVEPSGAFYIYADCTNFTNDSYSFSHDVLEKAGVAIAPGLDFGDHRANEHVRFSYPKPIPVLQEGIRRLKEFTSK
ncbi:MAG: pyridoxal phosphate-dependent aminotransferase [Betaproteobacteria bacterium]